MWTLAQAWPNWKLPCMVMKSRTTMGKTTKDTFSTFSCGICVFCSVRYTLSMARAVLTNIMNAMDTTMKFANLRNWVALLTSLRYKSQPLRTRERWISVELISLAPVWWLVNTDMSCEIVCSEDSVSGSTVQTVSLNACGRRFTRSSKPTMSLSVSRSSAFMPELSNSFSMCFMILAGDIAWMSSMAPGLPLTEPCSGERKGRQLASGCRSQTFFTSFTKTATCFATFGVLSSTTIGFASLIPWRSFFFICGCQQYGAPTKTYPSGATDSGTKGMASASSLYLVMYSQSTSAVAAPVMVSSR
mmetsp:Transcript_16182/g.48812  ORF Transcript_16182/g.48812 Transcript_16182/m.48812 type:complete len:302 (-) Transcript_16182:968-1873(-)